MMLEYTVPSRIAIDLYDMNGGLGRIDGGMGFSIDHPQLVFKATHATGIQISNESVLEKPLLKAVLTGLESISHYYDLSGVGLEFIESIPSHSGFGSKTATLLSTAHAFGRLHGIDLDYRHLAGLLGRGGTSGLGVNLIDRGGFIVDGGHSTREKSQFLPSSACTGISTPPVIAHYPMPNWPVLLIVPQLEKVSGTRERKYFQGICPVPEDDVAKLARVTLSQVLPAIVEGDLGTFCKGINAVQQSIWKSSEIGIYGDNIKHLMNRLLSLGAQGVGMSSIGPCVYAFGGDLDGIKAKLTGEYSFLSISKSNNGGTTVRVI